MRKKPRDKILSEVSKEQHLNIVVNSYSFLFV